MLRNYLAATLRGLARDRLHTAITTLSLAIGFAAVILSAIFTKFENSYDRFWPDRERLFMLAQWQPQENRQYTITGDAVTIQAAELIKAYVPEVEALARLAPDEMDLERGRTVVTEEEFYLAEENFFDLLKPRVAEGNLSTALTAPNSIVLTRSMARKYFGDTPALGQTMTGRQGDRAMTLRVTAVIEDLPESTHLTGRIFVSAATDGGFIRPSSPDERSAAASMGDTGYVAYTYLRVRPGVTQDALAKSLLAVSKAHLGVAPGRPDPQTLKPNRIDQVYMKDESYRKMQGGQYSIGGVREGSYEILRMINIIAGLILAVAAINFITLMTARGAKRAVEVGVRKASGARRRDLVVQFVGESMVVAVLSFIVAVALAEVAEPVIRAMTASRLQIDYASDLPFFGLLFAGALLIGAVAGVYPAFALSSFKPASVLKGGPAKSPGSAKLRSGLIALQFLPLIVLGLFAASQQLQFMRAEAATLSNLPGDPLLLDAPCTIAFKAKIRALPGVQETACMGTNGWYSNNGHRSLMIGRNVGGGAVMDPTGKPIERSGASRVSSQGLLFHKHKLLAGRLPVDADEERGGTEAFITDGLRKELEIASPKAALGRQVMWRAGREAPMAAVTIIGVLADRPGILEGERSLFIPTPLPPTGGQGLGIRLTADTDRAAFLKAIDGLWSEMGNRRPLEREYYSERVGRMGSEQARQVAFVFACIGVGALVGGLGLFGLAAFLAEQRTKEIGVRKAMGAGRGQVVRMLLFQFSAPVLVSAVIACPAAFLLMNWLEREESPARRSPMGFEVMAPVVIASLGLALLATFIHAVRMASARPVTALRYE